MYRSSHHHLHRRTEQVEAVIVLASTILMYLLLSALAPVPQKQVRFETQVPQKQIRFEMKSHLVENRSLNWLIFDFFDESLLFNNVLLSTRTLSSSSWDEISPEKSFNPSSLDKIYFSNDQEVILLSIARFPQYLDYHFEEFRRDFVLLFSSFPSFSSSPPLDTRESVREKKVQRLNLPPTCLEFDSQWLEYCLGLHNCIHDFIWILVIFLHLVKMKKLFLFLFLFFLLLR